MSHFTHENRFQNLFYLEKALNRLNIVYKQEQKSYKIQNLLNVNLVIPQSNGYDIEFCWMVKVN
jgi:hypothetical protein